MTSFITFEGTEGSGKTTQIRLLADALIGRGFDVVVTREPGGTELGEGIRRLLLESEVAIAPVTEAYLMTAARAEHVRQVIQPALDRGQVVLCDRFADSTFAYQGGGRGLPVDSLVALQRLAVGSVWPTLTVLLDVPTDMGLLRRLADRSTNRIDRERLDFHERVAGWFREAARNEPERWVVVDAAPAPDLVHTAILERVLTRLDVPRAVGAGSGFR